MDFRIIKIDNRNTDTVGLIYSVFQASYAVEAKLLKAKYFPPLHRTVNDFIECENDFYGFFQEEKIVAVTEILETDKFTHIQSLVVDPNFFRKGIASRLISFIFEYYQSAVFTVETGVDNLPAIKLYLNHGFVEVKQWDTEFGIRKIAFKKIMT